MLHKDIIFDQKLPEWKLSSEDAVDDWKNDESVNSQTNQNGCEVEPQLFEQNYRKGIRAKLVEVLN